MSHVFSRRVRKLNKTHNKPEAHFTSESLKVCTVNTCIQNWTSLFSTRQAGFVIFFFFLLIRKRRKFLLPPSLPIHFSCSWVFRRLRNCTKSKQGLFLMNKYLQQPTWIPKAEADFSETCTRNSRGLILPWNMLPGAAAAPHNTCLKSWAGPQSTLMELGWPISAG